MREKFLESLKTKGSLMNFHNLLTTSNYEGIYNAYGKNVFQLFAPYEYQKEDIEKLFKENRFEELREKYGNLYNAKVAMFRNFEKLKKFDLQKASAIGLVSLAMLSTACSNQNEASKIEPAVTTSTVYETDVISEPVTESTLVSKVEEETKVKETTVTKPIETTVETTVATTEPVVETTVETTIETTVDTPIETTVETQEEIPETTVFEVAETEAVVEETAPIVLKDTSKIVSDDSFSEREKVGYNLLLDTKEYLEETPSNKIENILTLDDKTSLDPNINSFYNVTFLAGVSLYNADVEKVNIERYQSYLDQYNKNLADYAEYMKSLNLSDIDLIAKIMDDQWASVEDGFGDGKYDIYGLFRVDIDQDNSSVKCRNLSDDFVAKWNAIKGGGAYQLSVYCDINAYTYQSSGNIPVRYAHDNTKLATNKLNDMPTIVTESVLDMQGKQASYQIYSFEDKNGIDGTNYFINVRGDESIDKTNYIGNHSVALIPIYDDNTNELKYNLVVDPTNVNISVLKDGKIYVLSNNNYEGLELAASGIVMMSSFDETLAIADAVIDSRARSEAIDVETLKDLYGVDQLNKSLDSVRAKYGSYESVKGVSR